MKGTHRFSLLLPGMLLLTARLALGAGVTVRFNPASPEVGPFPTDFLTTADLAQKTGLRVNLPLPDCGAQPSSCRELGLVNQLDGFNLQPRVRVRFSAAVNPDTLRGGIFLVWLDNLTREEAGQRPAGHVTSINQVIYDPATNTAYAKPDEILDQHRRYALVVTAAVRDRAGDPVEPDAEFLNCVQQPSRSAYCNGLAEVLRTLSPPFPTRARAAPPRIVAASVFTTLSATAWLEKARGQIQNSSISLQRLTPRAVFTISDILAFTLRLQVRANPPAFEDFTVPFPAALLTGVGRLAFGSFRSPSFLDAQQIIPQVPTGSALSLPAASNELLFHVFLPGSPMPPSGYPVIIFGHGLNDSRFGAPTLVASAFAQAGFATVAINAVGHGSGPQSRLLITGSSGTAEVLAGGRSLDLNGDGSIDSNEGCLIFSPPVGLRDCLRQTALDLMQLVRAIRAGADLDGDGTVDLDRGRIYYAGQSLGALYGTVLTAVEPGLRAAALNVGGGSVIDIGRWSPSFRPIARSFLEVRTPPLLNRPGDFNDNYVLRDRPAKVNDVPGAIEIQNLFETLEWLQVSGDPVAHAPHLKPSPLAGMGTTRVLWQFAHGDRTVPNPQTSQLIRAAAMRENSQFYRHDLARAVVSDLPPNPHSYLVDVASPAGIAIALAAQFQITGFFDSDGTTIPSANSLPLRLLFGRNLFETPAALPEEPGF